MSSHWIDANGRVFSHAGNCKHYEILASNRGEIGMSDDHVEAFCAGLMRVCEGYFLVGQWAGSLTASQRDAFLAMHDSQQIIVGSASDGYDFEDPVTAPLDPSARRQINQALRQTFGLDVDPAIYV